MEEIVRRLPEQIQEGVKLAQGLDRLPSPDSIVIAGMGGSGIAGEIFLSIYQRRIKVPIITHHSYDLPDYISTNPLFILISYSGNTEEVLSTLKMVKVRKFSSVAITSGGLLSKAGIPTILIPGGYPPRGAFGYLFSPIPVVVHRVGLIPDPAQELNLAAKTLKGWHPVMRRRAKAIAGKIYNRLTFIYAASPSLYPVAYRWGCQLNENAKAIGHIHYLPELDHNEVVGLEGLGQVAKGSVLILLKDEVDERSRKRIRVTRTIIRRDFERVIEVKTAGDSRLSRYLKLLWLGDMLSVHLARIKGVDPFIIRRIDRLKKELAR